MSSFKSFPGQDVYVAGKPNGKTAVICVFDIFGYYPQTQQGADILAETLGTAVYMPDFFDKNPYSLSDYLTMTSGGKPERDFMGWFSSVAPFDIAQPKLIALAKELKEATPGLKVATYGYCWGGQVVINVSGDDLFAGVAAVHPFGLDEKHSTIPKTKVALYLSEDEIYKKKEQGEKNPTIQNLVETIKQSGNLYEVVEYTNMHHGFAAARANLEDGAEGKVNKFYTETTTGPTENNVKSNKEAYQDVYVKLGAFFKSVL